MTRIDEPSGRLGSTAPAPRTNDDFLGWYQPVWFPWVRLEVRKDGEKYLWAEQGLEGPREALAWKSPVEPSELTPLAEGLGFAIGSRGEASVIYNEALKRFEMTVPRSHAMRMPLARIPAPASPEGGPIPALKAAIGIPSWR